MIGAIAALLLMQLAGTLMAQFLHIPLPGPVVGMLLLFGYLLWQGGPPKPLLRTSHTLLSNLSLLFVPAGVGILVHWQDVADQAVRVAIVLVLGVAITLVATAITLHWLLVRSRTASTRE